MKPKPSGTIRKMYSMGQYYLQYHPDPYDPFKWETIVSDGENIRCPECGVQFRFIEEVTK